jgi:L-fuconolactonase
MIDAHFHIWQLARGDYGWLTPALGAIHRDVSLDDWRQVRAASGVTAGILVQAAPTQAETHFLLEQARAAPDVLGVVGWVDMLAEDAPQRIRSLARDSKLCGLRPMLQDLPDPDWILQDALRPALDAMLACDLSFDALVKPVHLSRILALATRYPALRIVLDHGAKPDIAGGNWSDWASGVARLAAAPQVFCKLSGLWNEAPPGAHADALLPTMRHLVKCYGTDRILWGSDWPVLELAGTYAAWHAVAIAQVPPAQRGQVFGAVAHKAYRLPATR